MIGLLFNPNARRNKQKPGRRLRYERLLGRAGRVVETSSVDDIVPALKRFADEGRRYWVADGGDGALHWMLNEAVRYFGEREASQLAVYLPTGSGSVDFVVKALGLRGDGFALVERLLESTRDGGAPATRSLRTLWARGKQTVYGSESTDFRRLGFSAALGGYGANFYGPLYEGSKGHGAGRIAKMLLEAFGTAAVRELFQGPLEPFKPPRVAALERDFLRPLRAEVHIDGALLRGASGSPVTHHTALQAASVPLNLAGILRVFPLANNERLHVQAGFVRAGEMARIFPRLMTGRLVDHLVPDAFDGGAQTLDAVCPPGEEMTPVLDGELFHRLTEVHLSLGPDFRFALP